MTCTCGVEARAINTTMATMQFAATGKADLKGRPVPVQGWHCGGCGKLWGKRTP